MTRPTPTLLDGGLATSLQQRGLAIATPVDAWLHSHPADVCAAHRAFADAGSEILLAGTFQTLPPAQGWDDSARAAVSLARQAAGSAAEVFASLGPASAPGSATDPTTTVEAATLALAEGACGLVLETFVDADALMNITLALRRTFPSVFIAACLCPREDGRLFSGASTTEALQALLDAGASAVGVNCGFGPPSCAAALREAPPTWPLWCKPNSGDLTPGDFVDALEPVLPKLDFVGGCCGTSPAHISALRLRLRPG